MTDKDQQLEHFREAVDRKAEEADAASHANPARTGPVPDQPGAEYQDAKIRPDRAQDAFSIRDKNTGKGKKTADKWNQ